MTVRREDNPNMVLLKRELSIRPMTCYDAAEHLGIVVNNARRYMKILLANREIHICRWSNRGQGPWVASYQWGWDYNAPKPTRQYAPRRKVKRMNENPLKFLLRMKTNVSSIPDEDKPQREDRADTCLDSH